MTLEHLSDGTSADETPLGMRLDGHRERSLHARLAAEPASHGAVDPYAELKARVHRSCIDRVGAVPLQGHARRRAAQAGGVGRGRAAEAGPDAAGQPGAGSARPRDQRRRPRLRAARAAAPRHDRDRDHGQPLRRGLRRARRPDRAHRRRVLRRGASGADHRADRHAGRPSHRRGFADGRRPAAGRQPRERDHPAPLAGRADAHDPEVLPRAALPRRSRPGGHAQHARPRSSSASASAGS